MKGGRGQTSYHGDVYAGDVSPGRCSATTVMCRPNPLLARTRATLRPIMPALTKSPCLALKVENEVGDLPNYDDGV